VAGVDGPIVVGKVLEKSGNFGFDAQTEQYVDTVSAGIIDPTKVVLITTEAIIAEKPKRETLPPCPGGGMGGMGGMDYRNRQRSCGAGIRPPSQHRQRLHTM
jgi:chaperonin GroEL